MDMDNIEDGPKRPVLEGWLISLKPEVSHTHWALIYAGIAHAQMNVTCSSRAVRHEHCDQSVELKKPLYLLVGWCSAALWGLWGPRQPLTHTAVLRSPAVSPALGTARPRGTEH